MEQVLILLAETTESGSRNNWIGLGCCLLFMLVGFIIGYLIWRSSYEEARRLEKENRRIHSTYKKRERTFIENREAVSSVLGSEVATSNE